MALLRSVRSRTVFAVAGALGVVSQCPPAVAQPANSETLVVVPDTQGANPLVIKVSWRDNTNVRASDWLINARVRNWAIPSHYYISTDTDHGDSIHIWNFRPGFIKSARLEQGQLLIPRPKDVPRCFPDNWFRTKRDQYNNSSGVPDLFNGILLFGHMRSVCENEGPGGLSRANLAKQYVSQLYTLLTAKVDNTFSGHQCSLNANCN